MKMDLLTSVRSGGRPFRPRGALRAVRRIAGTIILSGCLAASLLAVSSLAAKPANLYEAVSGDERLALFANAVKQAGLARTLNDDGSYTLFSPSDQGMIEEGSAFLLNAVLLTPSNADRLADLVRHHIVPVGVSLETVDRINLPTLANVHLFVDRHGTTVIVGGRAIVTDHLVVDNGVLYVVDRLLWPRD